MSEKAEKVLEYLRREYHRRNQFYNLLNIQIEKAYIGNAIQVMQTQADMHTNLYGNVHGGAIMTIGDSCMGVACASLGKRVVTLDTNINFLSNIDVPAKVVAEANVVHNGSETIIMEAKIYGGEERTLMAAMRSTYFVIGIFQEIKELLDG